MAAISIITPTCRREALLMQLHGMVLAQSVQDFEWLILDESPRPCLVLKEQGDGRIRYHHQEGRLSIGVKRNWLVERASAPVIAHFDDDDYYAPDYLKVMARRMGDFVKLSEWFVYSSIARQLGHWNTVISPSLHYHFAAGTVTPVRLNQKHAGDLVGAELGFGFSYVYRRDVWLAAPFPERDFDEDRPFALAALANGFKVECFADRDGLCLHRLGFNNMSSCYPQTLISREMAEQLFPAEVIGDLPLW
jgi:glycosyltransferase involved in cell wall biosynthesis